MPRKARLDAPGTLHHVMVRGIERRRGLAGSDHGNNLFSIKEQPISNGFQILWGCFQARNIGHNHSSVHGA
jgi:hypothetical protein